MPTEDPIAAVTAIAAGVIMLSATVAEIVKYLRRPEEGRGVVLVRALLQATGNGVWVVHAVRTENLRLGAVTGIGCVLALLLLVQGLRGRHLAARNRAGG